MLFSVRSAPFTLTWPGAGILAVGARGVIKSESSQCLEMLSQAARVEWGPVLPRSTNHQVSNFVTLAYTWYIPNIYQVYVHVTELDTWWLVLRGRTGPHSSRASCDDISRPYDYSDLSLPALRQRGFLLLVM